MPIGCPSLGRRNPYERTLTARVDGREDSALQFSARLADDVSDVEVTLVGKPAPSYEIVEAGATTFPDARRAECMALLDRFKSLRGTRILPGFRRQVAARLGDHPLSAYLLDAALEAARLSRQVARVEAPVPADLDAHGFYRLDLAVWPELADTCFTYRRASDALFGPRAVKTPAVVQFYAPPPGKKLIFHRFKRTRLALTGNRLSLYRSMFDPVHGFEVWYDVDVDSQQVVDARLLTPKLPYMGLCEEPQKRIQGMIGATLDERWADTVRSRLGGPEGCFQLTDLTSDLFHLLAIG
jgi:hypothetical protein